MNHGFMQFLYSVILLYRKIWLALCQWIHSIVITQNNILRFCPFIFLRFPAVHALGNGQVIFQGN